MARETYHPDRGDLVHMNFQPSAGHEQTGPRYAIVLTTQVFNRRTGLCICCPITSKVKSLPMEVPIDIDGVRGVVLPQHVRSVDYRERGMSFVGKVPPQVLTEVVGTVLDFIDPIPA
jgi:mRNA interferase MazF